MTTNFMNLTDNYTTTKFKFTNEPKGCLPIQLENICELPIIYETNLPKRMQNKVHCSTMIPIGIMGANMIATTITTDGGMGWTNMLLPFVMNLAIEVGRVVFYFSGSQGLYKITRGHTKEGFGMLKNAIMGYGLLISLDGIIYLIETYVETAKAGLLGI